MTWVHLTIENGNLIYTCNTVPSSSYSSRYEFIREELTGFGKLLNVKALLVYTASGFFLYEVDIFGISLSASLNASWISLP